MQHIRSLLEEVQVLVLAFRIKEVVLIKISIVLILDGSRVIDALNLLIFFNWELLLLVVKFGRLVDGVDIDI